MAALIFGNMSNGYFSFKQFTVQQDRCAMKVCTDACLFGAWVATLLPAQQAVKVLDIGTGTGLLSLMVAQQTQALIDAVEIDPAAAEQAADNFATSPFAQRLQVKHMPVQDLASGPYDLIISNPPFYDNDLKSDDPQRNLALHSTQLDFDTLLKAINANTHPESHVSILVPRSRADAFIAKARHYEWHLQQWLNVRPSPRNQQFRSMLLFSHNQVMPDIDGMAIKDLDGNYTEQFVKLLQPYYLYL